MASKSKCRKCKLTLPLIVSGRNIGMCMTCAREHGKGQRKTSSKKPRWDVEGGRENWLTIGQVGKRVGVRSETVQRWFELGLVTDSSGNLIQPWFSPAGRELLSPENFNETVDWFCDPQRNKQWNQYFGPKSRGHRTYLLTTHEVPDNVIYMKRPKEAQ